MADNSYSPGTMFRQGSSFGNRIDPMGGGFTQNHQGQDYPAPSETPIPAASSGRVMYSGPNNSYGNTVIIESKGADGSTYNTLYAHQNGNQMPALGSTVNQGDTIGEVGSTGSRTTGPHLHFEVIPGKQITTPRSGGPTGIDPAVPRTDPNSFNNWGDGGSPYQGSQSAQPSAPAPTPGKTGDASGTVGNGYDYAQTKADDSSSLLSGSVASASPPPCLLSLGTPDSGNNDNADTNGLSGIVPANGTLSGSLLTGFDPNGQQPADPMAAFNADVNGANTNAPYMLGPIAVANDVPPVPTLLTGDALDVA